MTISRGEDTNKTNINNYLVGLYYYILDKTKMNENGNSDIFSYVPTIQSINFNPFLNMEDSRLGIIECDFDKTHFGVPSSNKSPKVYRVSGYINYNIELGEFPLYPSGFENDESILFMYPYRYFLLCDYLNPPMLIQPQLVKNADGKIKINVTVSLSQTSKYNLYVRGYKYDYIGNVEGNINNNPLLFPVGSSAYAQFLATSGQTFAQSNSLGLMENDISLKQGMQNLDLQNNQNIMSSITNGLGNLLSFNIGGAVKDTANTYFNAKQIEQNKNFLQENSQFKEFQIETMAMARKQDLINTPRTMKSVGNDSIFNLDNANNRIDLIEYGVNSKQRVKLQRYYYRYGYKVTRYGKPNLRSRKYYNFIKCTKCDIDNSKIPYGDIEQLEKIFESGITLWHVEENIKMKDYSLNNIEREV